MTTNKEWPDGRFPEGPKEKLCAGRYLEGLRPRRKEAGLTQTELARATGATKQSILQWETGQRWPSAEWLPKLAQACRCRIEDLYGPADQGGA